MNSLNPKEVIPQIKASQLDEIISDKNFVIIDVRDANGVATQGSIPKAVNIPLDLIEEKIKERDKDNNSVFNHEGPFLFCCTGGVMSYMAAICAQKNGIENIFNLEDGHAAWKKLKQAA